MKEFAIVAPSAAVHESAVLDVTSVVEDGVRLGSGVILSRYVRVCADASIEEGSWLGEAVLVGQRVEIGNSALITRGVKVCPNNVLTKSTNGRSLGDKISIGPDVVLHDEVELGDYAVVPTQSTIASIGSFGKKNRVVTIYASDYGPRYSIGCQIGVDYWQIRDRILNNIGTSAESASSYEPFIDVFQQVGLIVQHAYDLEADLVEELAAMRNELL